MLVHKFIDGFCKVLNIVMALCLAVVVVLVNVAVPRLLWNAVGMLLVKAGKVPDTMLSGTKPVATKPANLETIGTDV